MYCFQRLVLYHNDHIPKERIHLLKSNLLASHYQRLNWEHDDKCTARILRAWGKKHCNFPSPLPYLPAEPVFGVQNNTQYHLTVKNVLSKCHGYMWTFPVWGDEFPLSHTERGDIDVKRQHFSICRVCTCGMYVASWCCIRSPTDDMQVCRKRGAKQLSHADTTWCGSCWASLQNWLWHCGICECFYGCTCQ